MRRSRLAMPAVVCVLTGILAAAVAALLVIAPKLARIGNRVEVHVESHSRWRARRTQEEWAAEEEDEQEEMPGLDGTVSSNKAYEALTSWPVLPQYSKFIEGVILVTAPTFHNNSEERGEEQFFSQTIKQRSEKALWVFAFDPLDGAKALDFSPHNDPSFKQAAMQELKLAVSTVFHTQATSSTLLFLDNMGCKVIVGGGLSQRTSERWFLVLPQRRWVVKQVSFLQNTHRLELEWKRVSTVLFVTSSELKDLVQVIKVIKNKSLERVPMRLVRGFVQWGQGDLEQEVQMGTLWPCEKSSHLLLASESVENIWGNLSVCKQEHANSKL